MIFSFLNEIRQKGSQGCNNHLLNHKVLIDDLEKKHFHATTMLIDYIKLYDGLQHLWINKAGIFKKIIDTTINFIE